MADEGKGLLSHTFENYYGGQPRSHSRDAGGRRHHHGAGRRRRARLHHLRFEFAHFPAHPLGARPQRAASSCRWNFWCASRPATLRRPTACMTAVSSHPATAPTSTSSTSNACGCCKPEVVYDLPAGGKRLMQRARGYRHTFVAGTETPATTSIPARCRDGCCASQSSGPHGDESRTLRLRGPTSSRNGGDR